MNPSLDDRSRIRTALIFRVLILGAIIAFAALRAWPLFEQWQLKSADGQQLENQVATIEQEISVANKKLNALETEFDSVAEPFLVEERQILPEKLDTSKVSKILELYSLQLPLLDPNASFLIESLTFSRSQQKKEENFTRNPATIAAVTTEKDLQKFVEFLQSGQLTPDFETGKESGRIKTAVYRYLKENLLPLTHIESIDISEPGENNQLKVLIQVTFFSQK
jgi:hypothetical protein